MRCLMIFFCYIIDNTYVFRGLHFNLVLFLPNRYNEEDHNCFSFIMAFMKKFNAFRSPVHHVDTKENFAELYVAPTTIKAYKYIYLYRKITENGFYIYSQSSNEILCT